MVRYSVTMHDDLVKAIDRMCDSLGMSRSEWLNELCTAHLNSAPGGGVQTVAPAAMPPASVP
ncbi:MAG: ribbon-helix-helix protein, CopG family, partial [Methanoculleus sp.]|nr:ribbon-helix-helix protein, CopG family [Methanoculleus sp.]